MSERLRHTQEVRTVLGEGFAVRGTHTVLRALVREDAGHARWTVSASRRVGSAVVRNRAKRRLRAVLRQTDLPEAMDLVLLARPGAGTCPFGELREEVETLIGRARERAVARTGG